MTAGDVAPIVGLDEVGKRWDAAAALAPVTLTVGAGELVVVQGRSGSGKSTLIAILAGWCRPDHGRVSWSDGAHHRWADITVVPQILGVDDDLLVGENVAVPLRASGATRAAADAATGAALDALDLADLVDRWPRELSTGQRQRLAVARAVAPTPRMVLADEPTSHQDAAHASTVLAAIRGLVDGGAGAVVASHDPAVVELATSVVTLSS